MASPKSECEDLMNEALPLAERMLREHGEFYPYGLTIDATGKIAHAAASDGAVGSGADGAGTAPDAVGAGVAASEPAPSSLLITRVMNRNATTPRSVRSRHSSRATSR